MVDDFFEQLAQGEIPPPPPEFDRQLHARVNRSLLLVQLMDLVFGATPWAIAQLARALVGLLAYSVTGKFENARRRSRDRES
jgi:hypothetical protein